MNATDTEKTIIHNQDEAMLYSNIVHTEELNCPHENNDSSCIDLHASKFHVHDGSVDTVYEEKLTHKLAQVRSRIKLPRTPPYLCPCQNCGKIFESHQRLRSHYRHTHGEKKYKCDWCPLRFLNPKDLRSHLRTHTGEKPYVCDACGKGFSQMGSLKTHLKVHEKDSNSNLLFRPCPECSKKYCLKDRDKNVDYLDYFSSDLEGCICPNSNCAKKFSSSKSLRKHLRNDVCNPNKYHCGVCQAKFVDNVQLRYHVGTLHCTHKKRKS